MPENVIPSEPSDCAQYPTALSHLGAVAVVGKVVRAPGAGASDDILRRQARDARAKGRRRAAALEGQQVGAETGDVRGRHAGAGNAVGGTRGADPCGDDAGAGGEDVDDGSVVGPRRLVVTAVRRSDGADCRGRGGRNVTGVDAVVAGCNGYEHTGVDGGSDSIVSRGAV